MGGDADRYSEGDLEESSVRKKEASSVFSESRRRMVNTVTPQRDGTNVCIVSDNWEVTMTSA